MAHSIGDTAAPPGRAGAELRVSALSRRRAVLALHADAGWLAGLIVGVLALTTLPSVVAAAFGPRDLVRFGSFWFMRDFSQYLAAMREGATTSGWLIHDHFTAEPHAPILQYPLYVALGKLAALLGLDLLAVNGAAEVLGRIALVVGLHQFMALFLPVGRVRRLATLLALFSLGLVGWVVPARLLAEAFGRADLLDAVPASINVYLEINSFGILFAAPHLMFGMALTLLVPRLYLAAVEAPRPGRFAALGAATLALSLVHPFNLPVLVSVLAADALRRSWPAARPLLARLVPRSRVAEPASGLAAGAAWAPALAAGLAGLAAAPLALYNFVLFQLDPFWSGTYGIQNKMPAPPPWDLPIDFGLVLLLAPLGLWLLLRSARGEPHAVFLLTWVGLTLLWLYAPVPYQRRFGFGLQPALAVLAALGIVWIQSRAGRLGPIRRRLVSYGLLLLALNTTIVVYNALLFSAALNRPAEVYAWTRAEQAAADWLATASGPEDVVLASTEASNVLAGWIDGRVVHGHIVATYRSDEKKELVRRFFAGGPADELESVLRAARATIVFYGPRERELGDLNPDRLPILRRVYAADGVSLYRVVGR